jgi:hypothetical protein
VSAVHWLKKIEALKPGDACEFRFHDAWRPGVVIVNGGAYYWTVEGANAERFSGIYIEHVRLPGQTDAWPR